jgi:cell division septation protein DedD
MDTALKQRLIGAVVLVALAVIFLPMLIKGPAPDSGVSDVPLDMPATPGGQYETRELPLVTPGNAPDGGVVGMENGPTASTPPASEAIPLGTAPAAGSMLPAGTAGGNYAVNFGAYATPADADAVIARLKQAALPSFREPATINGRNAYRVRIGPYVERADAEAARLKAGQVRNDVKAQVVTLDAPATATAAAPTPTPAAPTASVAQPAATAAPVVTQALPPEAPKPAATPAAKPAEAAPKPVAATPKPEVAPAKPVEAPKPAAAGVGFAVQLGAFSKASDADAMRDKLRAGGFSAFVEQVKTDKGTLSRVRVGPVASRADADRLKAQVAAKVGINGMVRPHP